MRQPSTPSSEEEFAFEAFRKNLETELQKTRVPPQAFSENVRLWLALTPGWTPALAAACRFPQTEGKLETAQNLFERLHKEGIVRIFQLGEDGPSYYTMTDRYRAETLESALAFSSETRDRQPPATKRTLPLVDFLQNPASSLSSLSQTSPARDLVKETGQIGKEMEAVLTAHREIPQSLQDWAALASRVANPEGLIQFFTTQVSDAFEAKDIARILTWVETARPLAYVLELALEPGLSMAIGQAGRQIELLKRRQSDNRHLVHFFRRAEQVQAVKTLFDGPEDLWALHFIGGGGVGKTTLMRYISCMANAQTGDPCAGDPPLFEEPVALARVDFDYLNPDYPRLNPGLLLWALAEELMPYAESESRRRFQRANRQFEELHQRLKADQYLQIGQATAQDAFLKAVSDYVEALRLLKRRVILILDTCEELAKADTGTGQQTSVEETFRILTALHDGPGTLVDGQKASGRGLASLRVILSGRRLLASHGHGWHSPGSQLPERPYLRLYELKGFSPGEAERYLQQQAVPQTLIPTIIQVTSPDAGISIPIVGDDQAAPSVPEEERCNPYQIRLFMDWAKEDPSPKPGDMLRARGGNYVVLRIIDRLHDDRLRQILPTAALLGHMDQALFQAVSPFNPQITQQVFDSLQAQEWVHPHTQSHEASGRLILSLDRRVRDRLYAYYLHRGEGPAEIRTRAQQVLSTRILGPEADLGALEWTDFDAALRVWGPDISVAVDWWQQVEHRLFEKRDPPWVADILSRLVSRDGSACLRETRAGPEVPPENPLRPMVLAALIRARYSRESPVSLVDLWAEIADKAYPLHTLPAFERLYRRSLAGQLQGVAWETSSPDASLLQTFWQVWMAAPISALAEDSQQMASWIAALEAMVEGAERLWPFDLRAAQSLVTILETGEAVVAQCRMVETFSKIAARGLEEKTLAQARQRLDWIRQDAQHDFARREVITALVAMGEISQALALVRYIRSESEQVQALCALAQRLYAQDPRQARDLVEEARALAQSISFLRGQLTALGEVVRAYANLEDFDQAFAVGQGVLQAVSQEGDAWEQQRIVLEVLWALALVEDAARLSEPVAQAVALAQAMSDQVPRAQFIRELVGLLVWKDQLEEAAALSQQIPARYWQEQAWGQLARGWQQRGDSEAANRWIEQIWDPVTRIETLCVLARSGPSFEDRVERRNLIGEAQKLLPELPETANPEVSFYEIALSLTELEDFDQAETWARKISDPRRRGELFGNIAVRLYEVGEHRRAFALANAIEHWIPRAGALGNLLHNTESEPEWAASVLSELQQLADQIDALAEPGSGLQLFGERCRALETLWQGENDIALVAFGHSLVGRVFGLIGQGEKAREAFAHALALLTETSHEGGLMQAWNDWRPPDELRSRVSLEMIRGLVPDFERPQKILDSLSTGLSAPTHLDQDRLQSLILKWRLAEGVGSLALPLGNPDGAYLSQGRVNALRETPPWEVQQAVWLAARGEVTRALARLEQMVQGTLDLEIWQHVERARLRIIRRMRLMEEEEQDASILTTSGLVEDLSLVWSLGGFMSPARPVARPELSPYDANIAALHASWQARYLATESAEDIADFLKWILAFSPAGANDMLFKGTSPEAFGYSTFSFELAAFNLDMVEARLLLKKESEAQVPRNLSDYQRRFSPLTWWERHPTQPEQAFRLLARTSALEQDFSAPAETLSTLKARLGVRFAAEILYEEAELLALRLPAAAGRLFSLAETAFQEAEDALGILFTQVELAFEAMAIASSSRERPLANRLDLIKRAYQQTEAAGRTEEDEKPLPEWDELVRIANNPEKETLDTLGPQAWRPWLLRIIALLARTQMENGPKREAHVAAIRQWVHIHYGATVEGNVRLPAEWERFLEPSPVEGTAVLGNYWRVMKTVLLNPLSEFFRRWGRTLATIGVLVLGFFLCGGLITMLRGGEVVSPGTTLSIFIGVIGGVLLLLLALGSVLLWLEGKGFLEVSLRQSDRAEPLGKEEDRTPRIKAQPADQGFLLRATQHKARLRLTGWPLYKLQVAQEISFTGGINPSAAYEAYSHMISSELQQQMAEIAQTTTTTPLHGVIMIEESLAPIAWEALWGLALRKPQHSQPSQIPLRLARRPQSVRRPGEHSPPFRVMSIVGNPLARETASAGWAPLASARDFHWTSASQLEVDSEVWGLHLIGSVEAQLDRIGFYLSREQFYTTQIGTSLPKEESTFMTADQMFRAVRNSLRFLVLQAEMAETHQVRLESDRFAAGNARRFAAQMAQKGVTVLILPPLPPRDAAEILNTVADATVDLPRKGELGILNRMGPLQDQVFQAYSDANAGWEAAFDVCLYAVRDEISSALERSLPEGSTKRFP